MNTNASIIDQRLSAVCDDIRQQAAGPCPGTVRVKVLVKWTRPYTDWPGTQCARTRHPRPSLVPRPPENTLELT